MLVHALDSFPFLLVSFICLHYWDQLHLVPSHASRQMFTLCFVHLLFMNVNKRFPFVMRHLLSRFWEMNYGERGPKHVQCSGKFSERFPRAFPLRSRDFPNRFSPALSHEMSWMKMCFMSYYTILLFSISKLHSVFIYSWNGTVRIYQRALASHIVKDYLSTLMGHSHTIYGFIHPTHFAFWITQKH